MPLETVLGILGKGMIVALQLFVWTLVGSLPLGMLVCLGRQSKIWPLRWFMRFYISILRGTPLMLQLLVVYFGPFYLLGIQIPSTYRFTAAVIAFIINYAAYFAEIYRGGLESIPQGQYEAADVLGYSTTQTFFKIVLPQVIKRILAPISNEVVTLIKDTSLAFAIGVAEIFTNAQSIAASQRSMLPFAIAALIYWVFNILVELVLGRVEKKFDYYHD